MVAVPTSVDEVKLAEYRGRLPPRLSRFLDNFFGTCEPFDPDVNYVNYLNDLDAYGASSKLYRDHRRVLVQAFNDITGWRPDGHRARSDR